MKRAIVALLAALALAMIAIAVYRGATSNIVRESKLAVPSATDLAPTRVVAQAHGHRPGEAVLGAPPVFLFEPHQPEQCNWKPQVLLDISSVWEQKRKAFEFMAAQEHLWEYYTRVALQRGVQASRNSDLKIKYAEGYQRVFPQVTGAFL